MMRAEQQNLTEEITPLQTDFISFNALYCIYNQNKFCAANQIRVGAPDDTDGTLSICETYERRPL